MGSENPGVNLSEVLFLLGLVLMVLVVPMEIESGPILPLLIRLHIICESMGLVMVVVGFQIPGCKSAGTEAEVCRTTGGRLYGGALTTPVLGARSFMMECTQDERHEKPGGGFLAREVRGEGDEELKGASCPLYKHRVRALEMPLGWIRVSYVRW